MRRLAVPLLILALLLAAPAASAFRSDPAAIDVAYAAAATPAVLAAGELHVSGEYRDALMVAGLNESRFGPIPELTLTEVDPQEGPRGTSVPQGTLLVHSGLLVWWLDEGAALGVDAHVDYGIGFGLPRAPFAASGDENAEGSSARPAPPGLMLAGPAVNGTLSWAQGSTDLFLADALVTVLDATGAPLEGWERRRVNENASAFGGGGGSGGSGGDSTEEGLVLFLAEGAFDSTVRGSAWAGGVGKAADLSWTVRAAPEDRFVEALQTFADFASSFAGPEGEGGPFGPGGDNPLEQLAPLSGILNGAILLVASPLDEGGGEPAPLAASVGGRSAEVGRFTMFRSQDMRVAYAQDEMRVQGNSTVALMGDGFAVEAPPSVGGYVPLLSVFLWIVAAGAIVVFVVKRPPKGKSVLLYRGVGALVNVVALLVVFYFWDQAFAQTFGTSALTHARAVGLSPDTMPQIMMLFGLEMVPWGLAMVLFALPVRIALGVALRYVGKGKSFTGVANAGGIVALGILGPLYALWLLNVMVGVIRDALPAMNFGG